jgi:hypothetical protein
MSERVCGELKQAGELIRGRRGLLGVGLLFAQASMMSRAHAWFAPDPMSCPAGSELKSIKIRSEISFQERSISILGFGTTQKIPVRVVTTELECVPKPKPPAPPPPPPAPPRSLLDIFDLDAVTLDWERIGLLRADAFRTAVVLPTVVQHVGTSAVLSVQGLTLSGNAVGARFAMVREGSVLRFASPGNVDFWLSTQARQLYRSTWAVEALEVVGAAYGIGTFGVAHFLGQLPLSAMSGTVSVARSGSNVYNQN